VGQMQSSLGGLLASAALRMIVQHGPEQFKIRPRRDQFPRFALWIVFVLFDCGVDITARAAEVYPYGPHRSLARPSQLLQSEHTSRNDLWHEGFVSLSLALGLSLTLNPIGSGQDLLGQLGDLPTVQSAEFELLSPLPQAISQWLAHAIARELNRAPTVVWNNVHIVLKERLYARICSRARSAAPWSCARLTHRRTCSVVTL